MQANLPKTSRGIQESDVWAAADALIAQGLRPTIERVRLHIGRGSPNTVSPMLENWFGTLGARLGVNQQVQDLRSSVPTSVLEAAQGLWAAALTESQAIAVQAMEQREQDCAAVQAQLAEQQAALAQREEGLQQQKSAMDGALKLAQAQREDLSRRLDAMQTQIQERDALLERLRQEAGQQRQAAEAQREQHAQELQAAAAERQRLAEQFSGNERRMLGELDRSRQEVDKGKKALSDAQLNASARYEELQARHLQSEEALIGLRAQQINLQQALDMAQERLLDSRAQLERLSQTVVAPGGETPLNTASEKTRPSGSLQRRALSQRAMRLSRGK